jgi:hypothetical protein
LFHVIIKARMLMSGSVSNNAPNLGTRPETSAAATITAAEINALRMSENMNSGSSCDF